MISHGCSVSHSLVIAEAKIFKCFFHWVDFSCAMFSVCVISLCIIVMFLIICKHFIYVCVYLHTFLIDCSGVLSPF